jgi:hypothetical protein
MIQRHWHWRTFFSAPKAFHKYYDFCEFWMHYTFALSDSGSTVIERLARFMSTGNKTDFCFTLCVILYTYADVDFIAIGSLQRVTRMKQDNNKTHGICGKNRKAVFHLTFQLLQIKPRHNKRHVKGKCFYSCLFVSKTNHHKVYISKLIIKI